jgi:uncharacterized protein with von Willebrand factor type A (vWA) domain
LVGAVLLVLATSIVCTAQENKKLEYAILIDSTGSMRSQFAEVLRLGKGVAHQVHDHGPVSIFNFRSEFGKSTRAIPTLRIERSQDQNALDRTIDGLYVEGGQTTLLDAVDAMAESLNQPPAATAKVIIMITDGEDRVSEKNQKEVVAKLRENKISVYAIGLVQQLEGSKRGKASDFLKSLTTQTGGRVIFPKSDNLEVQNLLTELALPIQ